MRINPTVFVAIVLLSACLLEADRVLASSVSVPDGRVLELVTPIQNHNANVHVSQVFPSPNLTNGSPTPLPFAVAEDGSRVAYIADPTPNGAGLGENPHGNQYIAEDLPSGGWMQSNVQPAARKVTYYRAFSPDLSVGVLVSGSEAAPRLPPLSAEAPAEGYSVLYLCQVATGPCTEGEDGVSGSPYQPLYGRPLNRGPEQFGTSEEGREVYIARPGISSESAVFAGGSAGFGTVLFEANDALPGVGGVLGSELDEDAQNESLQSEKNDYLYARTGFTLNVVDVLPASEGGKVVSNATFGAPSFELSRNNQPNFSNVISADGARIYWTDLSSGVIYVRIENSETVRVSEGPARYWSSAADGRYSIYTENGSLYRFDLEGPSGYVHELLAGPAAGVLGVLGVSEDGKSVYFVAEGELAGASGEGVTPQSGRPNLYLWHEGEGLAFIATLSPADGHATSIFEGLLPGQHEYGDWIAGSGQKTARVSPDGQGLVFMSNESLPVDGFPHGYPTAGLDEVYAYDAASNRLFCASCGSSGESPRASIGGAAAFLPVSWMPTYLPFWISEGGGRVFFDSEEALLPQDTNGTQDVYEWERQGVGSCADGSVSDSGCLYLLSGGENEFRSWMLGADRSGNNVFMITRAQLTPQDQNEAYDLYDARVGGVRSPEPLACTGTGCQGIPAAPPTFATPPSVTFGGVGNFPMSQASKTGGSSKHRSARSQRLAKALRACRKHHGHDNTQVHCRAQARARYGRVARSVSRSHKGVRGS